MAAAAAAARSETAAGKVPAVISKPRRAHKSTVISPYLHALLQQVGGVDPRGKADDCHLRILRLHQIEERVPVRRVPAVLCN